MQMSSDTGTWKTALEWKRNVVPQHRHNTKRFGSKAREHSSGKKRIKYAKPVYIGGWGSASSIFAQSSNDIFICWHTFFPPEWFFTNIKVSFYFFLFFPELSSCCPAHNHILTFDPNTWTWRRILLCDSWSQMGNQERHKWEAVIS